MDASRKSSTNEYVYGNTVRKLHEVPYREEMPQRRKPLTKEEYIEIKKKANPANNSKAKPKSRESSMDLVSLLVLSMAMILTFYFCVSYLKVRSDITSMSKKNAIMESKLVELKNDNDTTLQRINTSFDLSYIYKTATKELGMVHADKDQIITYEDSKSDYVKKYADIPEVKDENVMDKLLDK